LFFKYQTDPFLPDQAPAFSTYDSNTEMTRCAAMSVQTTPVHRLLFHTIFLPRHPEPELEHYSDSTKVLEIVSTASTQSQGRSEKFHISVN